VFPQAANNVAARLLHVIGQGANLLALLELAPQLLDLLAHGVPAGRVLVRGGGVLAGGEVVVREVQCLRFPLLQLLELLGDAGLDVLLDEPGARSVGLRCRRHVSRGCQSSG